jgi:hypothetical protein
MYNGGITDGDPPDVTMLNDFADLWERAAPTDARRDIVGDDPVEFAETFAAAYSRQAWIDKERKRLTDAIAGRPSEEGERMTTDSTAIRVQGIEKSFKDLHVLRGVDFDVRRGASSPCSARTGRQDHARAVPVDAA